MSVITQTIGSSFFVTITTENSFGDLYIVFLGLAAVIIWGANLLQEIFQ